MQNQTTLPGLAGETLVLLAKAGEKFPIPRSPATLQRYWRQGYNGYYLETFRMFGQRYTSIEAIQRFVERSLNTPSDSTLTVPISLPKKRDIESARRKFKLPPSGKDGVVATK